MSSLSSVGGLTALLVCLGAAGCTPDVGDDPVPEAMEFDTEAAPPRVPQPIGLIVNPETGRLDFSLAGTELPLDCSESVSVSPAECEFDHYLETLDGFPTVSPAAAPVTAELDPATLTWGENVFVIDPREEIAAQQIGPIVVPGFDSEHRLLTIHPVPTWSTGSTYIVGIRGYAHGVRALSGKEVVGSPTMALLKADSSLTCDAATPAELDPNCPAFRLLSQTQPAELAKTSLFTLEAIRSGYAESGVWEAMAAAGLPKNETAVLWTFPIHSSAVAAIDPSVGLVPFVAAENEITVDVQGGVVDESTVSSFIVRERAGSVVLMDLTAAGEGNLVAGFPRVEASYSPTGHIAITGSAPFVDGHQYGIFMTSAVQDVDGASLVPAPISVLLKLTQPLVDSRGHSLLASVPDSDATLLELGRQELATLFDNPVFAALTGITRENLTYCFAFTFQAP